MCKRTAAKYNCGHKENKVTRSFIDFCEHFEQCGRHKKRKENPKIEAYEFVDCDCDTCCSTALGLLNLKARVTEDEYNEAKASGDTDATNAAAHEHGKLKEERDKHQQHETMRHEVIQKFARQDLARG